MRGFGQAQDTFTRHAARKLSLGILVLIAVVSFGAYGAVNAMSNLGESRYSGTAANRLDTLAADAATKNLFQKGTTIRTQRVGNCKGPLRPQLVREMGTDEHVLTVIAFYQSELPRLGWVLEDTSKEKEPRIAFTKDFHTQGGKPWTGTLELKSASPAKYKTGYNVVVTARPTGCD